MRQPCTVGAGSGDEPPRTVSAAKIAKAEQDEPPKKTMKFSERTNWDTAENELAADLRARRASGFAPYDLTVSNPTDCGFAYDAEAVLAPLSSPESLHYAPLPLGLHSARQAVAAYYRDADAVVPDDRLCLTTSTSEAYSFLFRLLCDVGDEVLVARPSYPLFGFIATLDGVRLVEYPLLYDPNADLSFGRGWLIDMHALASSLTARTRAVVVVHPNNPTGHFVSSDERRALQSLCAEHRLALIVDEVFLDYPLESRHPSFAADQPPCLTFVVSGISKVCGLPQMKISWIAALGPSSLVRPAMDRLEIVADTFLSMNAPAQAALPLWLERRHDLQGQIRRRMASNLALLDGRVRNSSAQRMSLQGGWTTVLRVPRTVKGREFAAAALAAGVLVQPGYFYGLGEGRAVLSLLTPADTWLAGLQRLPID